METLTAPCARLLGSDYVRNTWNRSGDSGTLQGAVNFFHQTFLLLGKDFRVNRVLRDPDSI